MQLSCRALLNPRQTDDALRVAVALKNYIIIEESPLKRSTANKCRGGKGLVRLKNYIANFLFSGPGVGGSLEGFRVRRRMLSGSRYSLGASRSQEESASMSMARGSTATPPLAPP